MKAFTVIVLLATIVFVFGHPSDRETAVDAALAQFEAPIAADTQLSEAAPSRMKRASCDEEACNRRCKKLVKRPGSCEDEDTCVCEKKQ